MKEDLEEREFKRGFNHGYLLSSERPELKLPKVDAEKMGPYYQGFDFGVKEQLLERKREQVRKDYGLDNEKSKDRGRSR